LAQQDDCIALADGPFPILLIAIGACERLKRRLRLLQIARVEALSKPAVDRSEKLASLVPLTLIAPEPCDARCGAELPFDSGLKLRRRFREFLAAFGYVCPAFRAVAIDMHLGFEPSCIVERARFNKSDPRNDRDIGKYRRPAFRTKVPLDWLTTVALVVEYLQPSLSFHGRFRNADQYREGRSGLFLTVGAMAHPDEGGFYICRIPNLAAQTAACNFNHFFPPLIPSI
jgi:hypothetical protein